MGLTVGALPLLELWVGFYGAMPAVCLASGSLEPLESARLRPDPRLDLWLSPAKSSTQKQVRPSTNGRPLATLKSKSPTPPFIAACQCRIFSIPFPFTPI